MISITIWHLSLFVHRCLFGSIYSVCCGVWDSSFPDGDFIRSVHSGRFYHLLEQTVSTGKRWAHSQTVCMFTVSLSYTCLNSDINVYFRHRVWTSHDETLCDELHFSPSLGSVLPGFLIQIPTPLGRLWQHLEHR